MLSNDSTRFRKACIFTTHKALRENTCPIASGDYSTPCDKRSLSFVRPQGQLINRVEVPVGVSHNVVAESNCVIAKWGGEQLEAKGQSAG